MQPKNFYCLIPKNQKFITTIISKITTFNWYSSTECHPNCITGENLKTVIQQTSFTTDTSSMK